MSGCPFNHETAEAPDGGTEAAAVGPANAAVASAAKDHGGKRGLSRRGLFSLAGVGGAGAVAGLAAGYLSHDAVAAQAAPAASDVVPFYGERQAGIITPAQDRLHIAAFDVTVEDRAALIQLLKDWTAAAEAMTTGRTTGATGAVDGPTTRRLKTPGSPRSGGRQADVDVRLWPGLFEKDGKPRFGLEGRRPDALIDLPHFPGDALEAARTGGDIVVQACADDPQVAVHAIRNLARIGFGKVRVRWSQLGFGRTSSTSLARPPRATSSASRTARPT
ncbi:probable deferrochelatase/peroxidase EfeN [Arthrobacter sp. Hiyo8]|nr:probable deferrochelatase/peroxidase EfeN [Arthrobacter sp. Hiyo8]